MSGSSHTLPDSDLPNLVPSDFGDEWSGECKCFPPRLATDKLGAGGDVSPLVRAAHLQLHVLLRSRGGRSRSLAAVGTKTR